MKVAVVGGGIAGASVGYELAASCEVTLFEAEKTCGYHSTGRSAALFTECYGDPVVRRLAIASRGFVEHPPPGFAAVPLVHPRPVLFVATAAQEEARLECLVEYRAMVPAVREVSPAEAVGLCPVLDPAVVTGGVLEPDARDIDVHALHSGFLGGLRSRGGRIVTSAPVAGLRRRGTGWEVIAADQSGDFDVVVNAAGAWCDRIGGIAGAAPIGLVPKRRTAFTFASPTGPGPHSWPMIIDVAEQFYFRPEGVHVLGSPCDETPMEPQDVRHDEMDVARGIERIESVTTMTIRSVQRAWAGLRSFVSDHRPVNGWEPDLPGFYWLAGQGGFGIKTSPAMARFAAAMIRDGSPPEDLVAAGITVESVGVERLRADS
ncbi:MAG TPA: FAD-binding oxidoreductase [Acidimicrobiia bacterium]|nr:FAD-binding oxidoreductase [Acidimicrobiia bacterium]